MRFPPFNKFNLWDKDTTGATATNHTIFQTEGEGGWKYTNDTNQTIIINDKKVKPGQTIVLPNLDSNIKKIIVMKAESQISIEFVLPYSEV